MMELMALYPSHFISYTQSSLSKGSSMRVVNIGLTRTGAFAFLVSGLFLKRLVTSRTFFLLSLAPYSSTIGPWVFFLQGIPFLLLCRRLLLLSVEGCGLFSLIDPF